MGEICLQFDYPKSGVVLDRNKVAGVAISTNPGDFYSPHQNFQNLIYNQKGVGNHSTGTVFNNNPNFV